MATNPTADLRVLLVEDNPGDARLIRHHLRSGGSAAANGPEVTHVESLGAAVDHLDSASFDLVLLDLGLAESHGLETLERLNDRIDSEGIAPVPIVVLTGLTDDETALRAIQEGAQDYLLKDNLEEELLERSVRYALERHRQERRLERQNERLERFASIVSHDLRNPLQVAMGRLDHVDPEPSTAEHLDAAVDALDRMEELVDDLLVLAREGETVDAAETVDIGDIAESAWRSVETPASDLRVEVTGTVTADAGRLTQLFENLFRNSVEHGSTDSRTQSGDSVEHGATNDDSGVTITVGDLPDGFYLADDGPGIPASEREAVFEAGYSTNEGGTGFGLDIVREIVEAHGWTITATESEAGGARFEITGMALDDG
jgi:signal transduction histidine kinase